MAGREPHLKGWPPLARGFYDRDVVDVARDLLGRRLVRSARGGASSGWIVEVEAYRGQEDPASHAFRGRTPRNAAMFGGPGRAYVYTIHAKFCLNAIAQSRRSPCGILIRAIEPVSGINRMRLARPNADLDNLTRGPGRLCQALGVDRSLDGWDLTRGRRLWIAEQQVPVSFEIGVSPRIGVSAGQEKLWRFFVDGNRFVSGLRRHHSLPKSSLTERSEDGRSKRDGGSNPCQSEP